MKARRHQGTKARRARGGFTLLELVLVLLVLAVLASMASPSLRGWGRNAKLKDEAERFMTATRYARSEAIARSAPHRLVIDPWEGTYQVLALEPEGWVPAEGELGRVYRLPNEMDIEMARMDGGSAGVIEFHANGRVTPVRVRVVTDWGGSVVMEARSPAQGIRFSSAEW